MVHIACLDPKCRRVIHLCNPEYWDFDGVVKCSTCGASVKIKIEEGKVILVRSTRLRRSTRTNRRLAR